MSVEDIMATYQIVVEMFIFIFIFMLHWHQSDEPKLPSQKERNPQHNAKN